MINSETTIWPYSPRNASTVASDAALLVGEPDFRLSPNERSAATAYAEQLIRYPGDGPTLESLIRINASDAAHTLHPAYFMTEKGNEAAAMLGVQPEDISLTTLAGTVADGQDLDVRTLRIVAARSAAWADGERAAQLAQPAESDASYVDPESFSINTAPGSLLEKIEGLKQYKSAYLQEYRSLKADQPVPLTSAKRVLLTVHMARVNEQLASQYPLAMKLYKQLQAGPDTEISRRWTERLCVAIPVLGQLGRENTKDTAFDTLADGFSRRLDMIRNGAVASNDDNPDFSPFTPELTALMPSHDELLARTEAKASALPAAIDTEKTWNSQDIEKLLNSMLAAWELRSGHSTDWHEVAERTMYAADGKWQVVVSPKAKSLSVNGKKKIVIVPEDFERTALQSSPSGALLVSSHEMTHVLQNEADEILAETIPLAKLKGRRSGTMREMGGLQAEIELLGYLGRERPIKPIYYRGLEAKRAGANRAEVTRAVYEARDPHGPDDPETDEKHRLSAVKQAERLFRYGGHNSQPLDYAESELMIRGLRAVLGSGAQKIAASAVGFSLADLAVLHRADLLHLPEQKHGQSPAQLVLGLLLEQKI